MGRGEGVGWIENIFNFNYYDLSLLLHLPFFNFQNMEGRPESCVRKIDFLKCCPEICIFMLAHLFLVMNFPQKGGFPGQDLPAECETRRIAFRVGRKTFMKTPLTISITGETLQQCHKFCDEGRG